LWAHTIALAFGPWNASSAFKQINDRFADEVGDQLLQLVAARLVRCVRAQDTVARYGGDEFVLLIRENPVTLGFWEIEERITSAMKRPVTTGGYQIDFSCSVGVSVYPRDGFDCATLLRRADFHMYCRKSAGNTSPSWVFRRDVLRTPGDRGGLKLLGPDSIMRRPKGLSDRTDYIRPVPRSLPQLHARQIVKYQVASEVTLETKCAPAPVANDATPRTDR
jgi:diguanylate cyclase (GGDEF)-like protein